VRGVDVFFGDEWLADVCGSEREMRRAFGLVRAKRLGVRLQQLRVAETLADIRLVTTRCHELTGDLRGYIALDLDGPYRLLFRPLDGFGQPVRAQDWSVVWAVLIDRIENYH
jgi:toxin HigB-1